MTKKERRYLDRVAQLGCIVCANAGHDDCPAEIHHIRSGVGSGLRAHYTETLPLCPAHHRTGGYGVAIHAGRIEWEKRYGEERALLSQVRVLLGEEAEGVFYA